MMGLCEVIGARSLRYARGQLCESPGGLVPALAEANLAR
jgi:hypothetical protein